MTTTDEGLLRQAYAGIHARDVERPPRLVACDVVWSAGPHQTPRLHGRGARVLARPVDQHPHPRRAHRLSFALARANGRQRAGLLLLGTAALDMVACSRRLRAVR